MNLLQSELSDELGEDPLDNVEVIQDQLEFFPYLCRFQVHVFFILFPSFMLLYVQNYIL
jgi:exportin-7